MRGTNFLANIFEWIGEALERFNPSAFRFLAATLPYSTPIPVAVLTSNSASEFLGFDKTVAGIFVYGLEGIGLWFTSMLVDSVVDWVRSKNAKSFVPVLIFLISVGAYVYILVNLNVTLEMAKGNINPIQSRIITLMCFLPLITGIGNGYYKLKLEHKTDVELSRKHDEEREDKIRKEKYNERMEKFKIKQGNFPKDNGKVSETYENLSESSAKLSENLPKDWRKLRKVLSDSDVSQLANLSSDQVREVASKYHVDERTVINWRTYAKKELSGG